MKGKGTHGHYNKVYLVVSDTEPENPTDGLLWYDPECITTTTTLEPTTTTTTTCQLPEGLYNVGEIFYDYVTLSDPNETIYPRTIEEACYVYNNSERTTNSSLLSCFSDYESIEMGSHVYNADNNCLLPSGYYMSEGVAQIINGEVVATFTYESLCSTTTTTTIQE